MAAPTVVQSVTGQATGTGTVASVTVSTPGNVTPGNALVAFIIGTPGTGTGVASTQLPASWVTTGAPSSGYATSNPHAYLRAGSRFNLSTSSDGSTLTFGVTWSSSNTWTLTVVLMEVSGVPTSRTFNLSINGTGGATGTTTACGTNTPTSPGALALVVAGTSSSSDTFSASAGWTLIDQQSAQPVVGVAWQSLSNEPSIADGVLSWTTSTHNVSALLVLTAASPTWSGSASDSAISTDVATRSALAFARSATDSALSADTATRSARAFSRTATDSSLSADVATRSALALSRSATDSALSADVATHSALALSRSASDSALSGDVASRSVAAARTATDTALSADVAARSLDSARTATDSCLSGDVAAPGVSLLRSATDSCSTADVAVPSTPSVSRSATDVSLTSDEAAVVVSRSATDTALSTDVAVVSGLPVERSASDTLYMTDVAVASVAPAPGPNVPALSNHVYEVVVCDWRGVAAGVLVSAVVSALTSNLSGIDECEFACDVWDPSLALLPISSIPGGMEVQVWRDGELHFWGWPISADVDVTSVRFSCSGVMWAVANRLFGPVIDFYSGGTVQPVIPNGSFEGDWVGGVPGGTNADGYTWSKSTTPGFVCSPSSDVAALGVQSAFMTNSNVNPDDSLRIEFEHTAPGPGPGEVTVTAWVFPLTFLGPAVNQNGLVVTTYDDDFITVADTAVAQITASTPLYQWTQLSVTVPFAPGVHTWVQVDLYCPNGTVYWDAVEAVGDHSVSTQERSQTTYDSGWLIGRIMRYAQDPAQGKSDLGILVQTTGWNGADGLTLADVGSTLVVKAARGWPAPSSGQIRGRSAWHNFTYTGVSSANNVLEGCSFSGDLSDELWNGCPIVLVGAPDSDYIATGFAVDRTYDLAGQGVIIQAIEEFPVIGACDWSLDWDSTGHFRWLSILPPDPANGYFAGKGVIQWNLPLLLDRSRVTDPTTSDDGSQSGSAQFVPGQGGSAQGETGYAAFPSHVGGVVAQGVSLTQSALTLAIPGATPVDPLWVGGGIYCIDALVFSPGTTVLSVDTGANTVTISKPVLITVGSASVGFGGVIIDRSHASIPDNPYSGLWPNAVGWVRKTSTPQVMPAVKVRADDPVDFLELISVGDAFNVLLNYGPFLGQWEQLMRLAAYTLDPVTEEVELVLNVIDSQGYQGQ